MRTRLAAPGCPSAEENPGGLIACRLFLSQTSPLGSLPPSPPRPLGLSLSRDPFSCPSSPLPGQGEGECARKRRGAAAACTHAAIVNAGGGAGAYGGGGCDRRRRGRVGIILMQLKATSRLPHTLIRLQFEVSSMVVQVLMVRLRSVTINHQQLLV